MKHAGRWPSLLVAFCVWFAHFLVCWAASEIVWPNHWRANAAAWVLTPVAWLVLGLHLRRLHAARASCALPGWHWRFAQGASALSAVAVLFSALPAVVLRPW